MERDKYGSLSDSQIAEIREKYAETPVSLQGLGEEYGMSRQGIHYIIRGETYSKSGGPILGIDYTQDDVTTHSPSPYDENRSGIYRLYVSKGESLKTIAEVFGMTRQSVKTQLRRAGVKIRDTSRRKWSNDEVVEMRRRYKNEDITQKQLSEEYGGSHSAVVGRVLRGVVYRDVGGPILGQDYGENRGRRGRARLFSKEEVEEIRRVYAETETSKTALANKHDVSCHTILQIIRGNTYRDVGGPLEKEASKNNRRALTSEEAKEIREKYMADPEVSYRDLSEHYDVSTGCISRLMHGETYREAGGPTLD